MASTTDRSGQVLASFSEAAAAAARQHGVDASAAHQIGRQASQAIRHLFPGERIYIAKGVPDASERAAKFLALRQDGVSAKDIAARFGLTKSWVHALVAREKARLKRLRDENQSNSRGFK